MNSASISDLKLYLPPNFSIYHLELWWNGNNFRIKIAYGGINLFTFPIVHTEDLMLNLDTNFDTPILTCQIQPLNRSAEAN